MTQETSAVEGCALKWLGERRRQGTWPLRDRSKVHAWQDRSLTLVQVCARGVAEPPYLPTSLVPLESAHCVKRRGGEWEREAGHVRDGSGLRGDQ